MVTHSQLPSSCDPLPLPPLQGYSRYLVLLYTLVAVIAACYAGCGWLYWRAKNSRTDFKWWACASFLEGRKPAIAAAGNAVDDGTTVMCIGAAGCSELAI